MNDTLRYFSKDPVYRKYEHGGLTFSMIYAFNENFMLPMSHDEVVHGKGSLLDKMPGDLWQKFANLRLLYGYMFGHPGKKLLFMGCEIAQWREWTHDDSLDWHLLQWRDHQGILQLVADLNALYRSDPAFHEVDFDWQGFEWLELHDWENSVLAFLRRARDPDDSVVVVCNFTPVVRATTTGSASRPAATTARSSTPTRPSTAARTSATRGASGPAPTTFFSDLQPIPAYDYSDRRPPPAAISARS